MSSPRGRKVENRYELKCFGLFYCVDDGGVVYCSRYIILLCYLYYFIVDDGGVVYIILLC